jgi:hypothetical protein
MTRRAARVDANHAAIVAALRAVGADVLDLSRVGEGCPDILIHHRLTGTMLIEIKDGDKSPSKRKLTEAQEQFHRAWRGRLAVVTSVGAALALVCAPAQSSGASLQRVSSEGESRAASSGQAISGGLSTSGSPALFNQKQG